MRKFQVLRRFATISMISCLLAACQMSANNLALTNDNLSQSKKTEAPRPLSTAGSAPVPAVDRIVVTRATSPKPAAGLPAGGPLTLETALRRALGCLPAVDEASVRMFASDDALRADTACPYPLLHPPAHFVTV